MEKVIILKNKKEVLVKFNTMFYPSECVSNGAKDFYDSCWISTDNDSNNNLLVTLIPKSKEVNLDTLGYEFYNYVLSIIKNDRKVQDIKKDLRFDNGLLSK